MAFDAAERDWHLQASPPCAKCHDRDREIERLRRELAQYERIARRFTYAVLAMGLVLLSVLPAGLLCGSYVALEWLEYLEAGIAFNALYGMIVGLLLAAPVVLGLAVMLHWGSLWRRGVIFSSGLALILSASTGAIAMLGDFGMQINYVASVYPAMLLMALAPGLAMGWWRRWTLAPTLTDASPRAASLVTILVATSLCAAAAAATRWFPADESFTSNYGRLGMLVVVFICVLPPSLTLGAILVSSLRAAMTGGLVRSGAWALGAMLASALAMAATIVLLCGLVEVDGQSVPGDARWYLALIGASAGVGAALCGLASFGYLRWAGYRLLSAGAVAPRSTRPDCLAPAASSAVAPLPSGSLPAI